MTAMLGEWTPEKICRAFRDVQQAIRRLQEIPTSMLATTRFYHNDDVMRTQPFPAPVAIEKLSQEVLTLMLGLAAHIKTEQLKDVKEGIIETV